MGLHHKICHVLGGTFGLPHAETHAALLPHVVAFNAPWAAEAMARVAAALSAPDAESGLRALNQSLGLTRTLGQLGLKPGDIPKAAQLTTSASYPNPRPATADAVRALLEAAM
jgi:maleylacetate reductase